MTKITYLPSPIAEFSNYDLRVLAADICSTLNWPPSERTLVHLFTLGLDASNQQVVYHWLKSHQEDNELPMVYRELCTMIYVGFRDSHSAWLKRLNDQ